MQKRKKLWAVLLCLALLFTCVFPAGAEEPEPQGEDAAIQPMSSNDYYLLGWNFFLSDTSAVRRNITNGYRRSDDYPTAYMHAAIDVAGANVSSVYARPVHDGTILRAWYDAVSYTHLDVYKRQALHRTAAQSPPPPGRARYWTPPRWYG